MAARRAWAPGGSPSVHDVLPVNVLYTVKLLCDLDQTWTCHSGPEVTSAGLRRVQRLDFLRCTRDHEGMSVAPRDMAGGRLLLGRGQSQTTISLPPGPGKATASEDTGGCMVLVARAMVSKSLMSDNYLRTNATESVPTLSRCSRLHGHRDPYIPIDRPQDSWKIRFFLVSLWRHIESCYYRGKIRLVRSITTCCPPMVARVGLPPTRHATGSGRRSGNGDMVPLSKVPTSRGGRSRPCRPASARCCLCHSAVANGTPGAPGSHHHLISAPGLARSLNTRQTGERSQPPLPFSNLAILFRVLRFHRTPARDS